MVSIQSVIFHAENKDLFSKLDVIEPKAMHGQPEVIWDKAEGCYVYDEQGNKFIDFTSGVLIANCGHNHPKVNNAIKQVLDQGLLTSYIFVNKHRVKLIESILCHVPTGFEQVLLFCSGSEAIEAALKLAKNYAKNKYSAAKRYTLSFNGSFHGRTLGSQLAGGIPALKDWIGEGYTDFIQVPFPDEDIEGTTNFSEFLNCLKKQNISPRDLSTLLFETYQGGVVKFAPVNFMRDIRKWCKENDICLIMDEVQAGFGRTGRWWGFEHYGIVPDLIVCGKGISSSLPVSAVIGRKELMDQFSPGAMSTTHSGNPLCCAAAAANIEVIEEEALVENAALVGEVLQQRVSEIIFPYQQIIKGAYGKGLVTGIHFINAQDAHKTVEACIKKRLMIFNPVGVKSTTVKINPPLTISKELLEEGLYIFEDVLKALF